MNRIKKVSFRIRKEYFDAIVNGTKPFELRKYSKFWRKRLLEGWQPLIAVFVCGARVHRRKITNIDVGRPEHYLGRELSEQGKKDIPTKLCIATHLGDVIEE